MSLFGNLIARLARKPDHLPVTAAHDAAPAPALGPAVGDAPTTFDRLSIVEITDADWTEEDEWEWQVAAARARLAAASRREAQQPRATPVRTRALPPPVPVRKRPTVIVPPLGRPLPERWRALPPLPTIGGPRRPAGTPSARPRHPAVQIPPLREAAPPPPRRMAHGTAPVERDLELDELRLEDLEV